MNEGDGSPLQRLDQICARMNSGLTAVAVVLGLMVAYMGAIRAAEVATDLGATAPAAPNMAADHPVFNLWTYD